VPDAVGVVRPGVVEVLASFSSGAGLCSRLVSGVEGFGERRPRWKRDLSSRRRSLMAIFVEGNCENIGTGGY